MGLILTGSTSSAQGDVFLAKTDDSGNILWIKTYGGVESEYCASVVETSDQGFIMTGYTRSFGNHIWVIKTDPSGDSTWSSFLGNGPFAQGFSVCESVVDQRYFVTGMSGSHQGYVAKLDSRGDTLWTRSFGTGIYSDQGNSIVATRDGGAILTGICEGPFDLYVMRFYSTGDSALHIGFSIFNVSATDFVIAGHLDSIGSHDDIFLSRLFDKTPIISHIAFDEDTLHQNVMNNTPIISWNYHTSENYPQDSFEIKIGTDDDWIYAEMWNPAPFVTSDTFVVYAGSELIDGETYYLRLRVNNGVNWSDWYETSFRMNSVPSVPVPLSPLEDEVTNNTPILWIYNATDAESDPLVYDFFCVVDTAYGEPDPIEGFDVPEGTDSTGWVITNPLDENKRYWWRARAFDGFEYSDWTDLYASSFFVNDTPEPPSAPQANFPPDTGNMPLFDMLPTFLWSISTDPDPQDTVRYKLEIAIDESFTFVQTIDSLTTNQYTRMDSLNFGTHYWWRVTAYDKTGQMVPSVNTPDFWTWTLGDVNHSHTLDISDLVYLVNYMFSGGAPIYPAFVGDINGNCSPVADISDLVYLVTYMFYGGPSPQIGCE